jgi:hypothetical protein
MSKIPLTLILICCASAASAAGDKTRTLLNNLPGPAASQAWQCVADGGEAILTITVDQSGSTFQGKCVFKTEEP